MEDGSFELEQRIRHFAPAHTTPTIACCSCGKAMVSNSGQAMCNDCISLSVDITEDVQKEGTVTFCKNCERLHIPPKNWIYAPRESRELLGACLKRLRGLNKLRLMDASYLWTEPHSRRTKIKVTVQGEAKQFQNTVVQQDFVAEFYEATSQCPDCAKSFTHNKWRATIQLRQKVPHKKTFFYLEQLILKHNAHKNTISIQETREGIDFFYSERSSAVKMVEFLQSMIPMRWKRSEQLVSHNVHTNAKNYKFSYSVEIVPICKEDLVVLPKKVAKSLGNINQLTLCYKIGNTVHLIDPVNLQTAELNPVVYFRDPFLSLASSRILTEFVVLDIEPAGPANNKFALADATVARVADMGKEDITYYVRTHLGGILHPGDTALGYMLTNSNFNSDLWDELDSTKVPDVILVKKSYADKTKKKKRNWKLKRMAKEYNDVQSMPTGKEKGKGGDVTMRNQADYEEFMKELEEDPEFRSEINLYKVENDVEPEQVEDEEGDEELDNDIEIKLEELKIEEEEDDDEEGEEEDLDGDENTELDSPEDLGNVQ